MRRLLLGCALACATVPPAGAGRGGTGDAGLGPFGPAGEAEQQDAFRIVEFGCDGRGVVHWAMLAHGLHRAFCDSLASRFGDPQVYNFRLARPDGVPACDGQAGANQVLQHFRGQAAGRHGG
jgi:hypothetical protein